MPIKRTPSKRKKSLTVSSQKALLSKYKANERANNHTANYLLLAQKFGTAIQVKRVKAIIARNKRRGYTDSKDNSWMYKTLNHHYAKLVKPVKAKRR